MKIWSATLTPDDLFEAVRAVNAEFPGCDVSLRGRGGDCELVDKRSRRIEHVHLRSSQGRYHPNTGSSGAAHEWQMAASWTEWGWFLARVFERDPDARCGDYHGIDDFHEQTMYRFRDPRPPRERQIKRELQRSSA